MPFQHWPGGEQGFNQPSANRQAAAGQQYYGESQAMPPVTNHYESRQYLEAEGRMPRMNDAPQGNGGYPPPSAYAHERTQSSGGPRSLGLSLLERITPREEGSMKKTIFIAGMVSGLVIAGAWRSLAKGGVKMGLKAGQKIKELSMQIKEDLEDMTVEAVEEVSAAEVAAKAEAMSTKK